MKLLALFTMAAALFDSVAAQQQEFCGSAPCLVPLNHISCETLAREYAFQGSCCALIDIPTGGCRVEVRSGGNCYWFPKCGSCDQEKDKCNTIYSTSNSDPCPESLYYTVGDKPAGSDTPTMSPTCSAPIPAPQMPTEPNPPAPAPSAAVTHRMMTMFMVFVLSTIYFVI